MERRTFMAMLTGGLLAAPLAALAQQTPKIPKIGVLVTAAGPYIGAPTAVYEAFRRGLRDLGYIEGRNVSIEFRAA